MWENRIRTALRVALSVFFVGAGAMHFIRPAPYVKIMPPGLPQPLSLVLISGVCEMLGGVGVLVPRVRRAAGWGLIALLVAVFPANVHMAVNHAQIEELRNEWFAAGMRVESEFQYKRSNGSGGLPFR